MKKKIKRKKNLYVTQSHLHRSQRSQRKYSCIPHCEKYSSSIRISEHFFLFFFFCYKVAHGFKSIARQYSSLVTFLENLSGHRIGFLNSSAKSHGLSWQPCTFRTSETRTNRYLTQPTNKRRAHKHSAVTNLTASRQIAQKLIRPMGTSSQSFVPVVRRRRAQRSLIGNIERPE